MQSLPRALLGSLYIWTLMACPADAGPDSPQITTFIHDPYIVAEAHETGRCPRGDDQSSTFVVFDLNVHRIKGSTAQVEAIPSAFAYIGLYQSDQIEAIPAEGTYGLLLDYSADLQLAHDAPSSSILGGLSEVDKEALVGDCGVSISGDTTRIKMGPIGATLLLVGDSYCNAPHLGPEACWSTNEVHTYLEQDSWRGPKDNYDPF